MLDNVLQAIGRTPLIRLNKVTEGLRTPIYVKVEAMNPGGSVKDRVGLAMITDAERKGHLKPGGTIIEATAGNTGVGLAMAAAVKGYRCIFVLPDKMSQEKISLLKAYGAEIVITATNVPPNSPESYAGVADRLTREIPGAWRPNQFANLSNPEIHYRTTGPEIWQQSEGRVTALVAGVGTGGTLSGAGRYLKEQNPDIKLIGADPDGSILSGSMPKSWKVEGIGEDFVPRTLDSQIVDEWICVKDADSFYAARAMARKEGLLLGGSAGTNVAAAIQYARRLGPNDLVVVIGCDTGRNYLSKFYDDNWMRETGLLKDDPNNECIGDMLKKRGDRPLISIAPTATVAEAIDVLQKRGISQMPVVLDGQALGSVQEITVARFLQEGHEPSQVQVKDVMAKPLPQLDVSTHIDEAFRLLQAGNTGVLATLQGKVVDIVTRIDLIQYWNQRRKR
ncbi:MAG: cystathionine beta-synthase [Planctomycetia bacterium]|nr:cystathionine beta-synthase [Planctomycetia bacterium]